MLFLLVTGGINHAHAKPPYVTPEQVKEQAKVILTGKVDAIRTRDEEGRNRSKDRIVLLQITVDAIEKGGDLIKPGDVIAIRCWRLVRPEWNENWPGGWIETNGTSFIPSEGGRARFFLGSKSDEGWVPVFPGDGVVRVDDTPPLEFPMEPVEVPGWPTNQAARNLTFAAFAVGGAVVLLVAVWWFVSRSRRKGLQEPRLG